MFLTKEDQLLSWDSYEIDNRWVNLKSLPDKIKDKDYAIKYYTEGLPKDCNEKIGYLYTHSLFQSTKDSASLMRKNMNTVSIH